MAAIQGVGLPGALPEEEVFTRRCLFMLPLDGSVGFCFCESAFEMSMDVIKRCTNYVD